LVSILPTAKAAIAAIPESDPVISLAVTGTPRRGIRIAMHKTGLGREIHPSPTHRRPPPARGTDAMSNPPQAPHRTRLYHVWR